MKTFHTCLSTVALLALATIAHAQMYYVGASQALNPIVGVYSSSSVTAYYSADWATFTNGSTIPANTGETAGLSNRSGSCTLYVDPSVSGTPFYNGSARSTLHGTNNGYADLHSLFVMPGTHTVSITIWGPTLDNFGVHGARNFSWTISDHNNSVVLRSGTGEAQIDGLSCTDTVTIIITPTDPNENGDVIAMVNG